MFDRNAQGDVEAMLGFFVAETDFCEELDALCWQAVLEDFPDRQEEGEAA